MGFDGQQVCQECHTAGTANWRTAPTDKSFVAKDTLILCRQISMGLESNDPDAGARADDQAHARPRAAQPDGAGRHRCPDAIALFCAAPATASAQAYNVDAPSAT